MADIAGPVAGVDGCRGGWVVVEYDQDQPDPTDRFKAEMVTDIGPLIGRAVLVITASHVAAGTEYRFGSDIDRLGLMAQIVY